MVCEEQSSVRILDGSESEVIQETPGVEEEDFEDFNEEEEEDYRQVVDLGLDISTSIVGVTLLDKTTGNFIKMAAFKLNRARFKDTWDKADHTRKALAEFVDTDKYEVKRIFVEEAAKKFSPGFSSANTIFTLASFNGIVSYQAYELFGAKPKMINVRSARKKLGIKINYKDKSKDTKTKVFEAVRSLNPDFPWEQHVAKTGKRKGQTVYGKQNFDMADAWIICRGGQLLHPYNPGRR